jgi:hypothetical protein
MIVDGKFIKSAVIHEKAEFIHIVSTYGYRQALRADDGYEAYLEPHSSTAEVGSCLLDAIANSKMVDPVNDDGFFNAHRIESTYNRWYKDIIEKFNYKSKSKALRNMKYCIVYNMPEGIVIQPHRQFGANNYDQFPDDMSVVIPGDSDAEQAGVAVRLALSRCC